MDKYYMKQKACQPCRAEAEKMRDEEAEAPPPPPAAEAKPDQDQIDQAADAAAGEPSTFSSRISADETPNFGGVDFEEPAAKPAAVSTTHKPTGRANLFDDDDEDIFADKKKKKSMGVFDDE